MSFWYYKREKDGKKSLIAVDIPVLLIMMILGLLAAFFIPRYLGTPSQMVSDAFHLIAFGFLLLLIPKISLFVKGIWASWGYSRMSKFLKLLYILGYILIGFGIIQVLVIYKNLKTGWF